MLTSMGLIYAGSCKSLGWPFRLQNTLSVVWYRRTYELRRAQEYRSIRLASSRHCLASLSHASASSKDTDRFASSLHSIAF
jgi:hypothetical protein